MQRRERIRELVGEGVRAFPQIPEERLVGLGGAEASGPNPYPPPNLGSGGSEGSEESEGSQVSEGSEVSEGGAGVSLTPPRKQHRETT